MNIEKAEELLGYLKKKGRLSEGERPRFEKLPGGVSNRTVRLEWQDGRAWVLKQGLEKLRVEVDWFSSPERTHREALALRWLPRFAPPGSITPLVFEDRAHHLLVMQAVPRPHHNWKEMLLRGRVQSDHVYQFGRMLACIHSRAYAHREEIQPLFQDRSFFESLRLEPYYAYTASQVPEAAPFLQKLIQSQEQQQITLVHGDYSPKNILVHEERLILLDHEVAHLGDPAFDLGFAMTHFLSKAHHLQNQRSEFSSAALHFWETYRDQLEGTDWNQGLERRAVKHTLGCLLARVEGRSPLEYLNQAERLSQRKTVLQLMSEKPPTMPALIRQFRQGLETKNVSHS